MRTTLSIRDELYEQVRRQAFEQRRSLGEVVNELIETGLKRTHVDKPRTLGTFAGRITLSKDFDDDLEDFTTAMAESIEP